MRNRARLRSFFIGISRVTTRQKHTQNALILGLPVVILTPIENLLQLVHVERCRSGYARRRCLRYGTLVVLVFKGDHECLPWPFYRHGSAQSQLVLDIRFRLRTGPIFEQVVLAAATAAWKNGAGLSGEGEGSSFDLKLS